MISRRVFPCILALFSVLHGCLLPEDFRGPELEDAPADTLEAAMEANTPDVLHDVRAELSVDVLQDVRADATSENTADQATDSVLLPDRSEADTLSLDATTMEVSTVDAALDTMDASVMPDVENDVVADRVVADAPFEPAVACLTGSTPFRECSGLYATREDFRNGCLAPSIWDLPNSGNVAGTTMENARFRGAGRLVSQRAFDAARNTVHAAMVWRGGIVGTTRTLRTRSTVSGTTGMYCSLRNRADATPTGWQLCTEISGANTECQSVETDLAEAPDLRMEVWDNGSTFTCTLLALSGTTAGMSTRVSRTSDLAVPSGRIRIETSFDPSLTTIPTIVFDEIEMEYGMPQPQHSYDFNEVDGMALWDSVRGNTGTGTGAGFSRTNVGAFGNAVSLNGDSANVSLPGNVLQLDTGDFTISFWYKRRVARAGVEFYDIFTNRTDPAGGTYFGVRQRTEFHSDPTARGRLLIELRSAIPLVHDISGPLEDIPTNTWFHLAFVRSGTRLVPYLDGTPGGAGRNTGDPTLVIPLTTMAPTRLGGSPVSPQTLNGQIDGVRVWRTALTNCQVQTLLARP